MSNDDPSFGPGQRRVGDPADVLDDAELAELDAALEAGQREYARTGEAVSARDVLARLRPPR